MTDTKESVLSMMKIYAGRGDAFAMFELEPLAMELVKAGQIVKGKEDVTFDDAAKTKKHIYTIGKGQRFIYTLSD